MKKLDQIYLIDDSKAVNKLNEALLLKLDVCNELLTFDDSQKALENIYQSASTGIFPNVIFLDIEMPNLSGFDFLDKLFDFQLNYNLKHNWLVVFLSNHLTFENFTETKYYKNFASIDHLRKPMDEEDIQTILEEHFN